MKKLKEVRMLRQTMISVSQTMTSSSTARVSMTQQSIKGNIEKHGRQSSLSKATIRYATALMGKAVWTVVDKVVNDDFETSRTHEDKIFEDKNYSPVIDPGILKSLDFSKSFWYLWPTEIDDDVSNINSAIVKENHGRKERYQRSI